MKLKPILNREGKLDADWMQLAPIGEFVVGLDIDPKSKVNAFGTTHDRAVQLVDAVAVRNMAGSLPEGAELLIDFEHFSHEDGKSTEAAGWIRALENREDGLYFQGRWSDLGDAALQGKRYRFISPTWNPSDCEIVENTAAVLKIRPLRLRDAGLTNRPNLRGLRPLVNRQQLSPETDPATATGAGNKAVIQTEEKTMLKEATILALLAALSLPPDSTDEQVMGAIDAIKNKMCDAGEKPALQNRINELLNEQIDADLNAAGVTEEGVIALVRPGLAALKNRADRVKAIGSLKVQVAPDKPLTNRAAAKVPGEKPAAAASSSAEIVTEVKAIQNRDRCSYDAAFRTLEKEKPALFAATA